MAEEEESMIPREARPVRVPAHVQKLRERRRADPVERTTVMTRKLSGEIHLHLRHRSHPVMTGNSTVRKRCSSGCPDFHRSFN